MTAFWSIGIESCWNLRLLQLQDRLPVFNGVGSVHS